MNRIVIALVIAFSFSFLVPTGSAQIAPSVSDKQIKAAQDALNTAIRNRQIRYLLELKRGHENRNENLARHNYSLFRKNLSKTSTFLEREGELKDVPYYDQRRAYVNSSLAAPNNPKRNFRVRAIDYYLEGGDAGKEVLEENVTLGSQHRVDVLTDKNIRGQRAYADVIAGLRATQRSRSVGNSTTLVPFSQRTGDGTRNFIHPFMKFLE